MHVCTQHHVCQRGLSPGGAVTAGLAIYDTMQFISPPVHTLCMGQACSMASILLAAGADGQSLHADS